MLESTIVPLDESEYDLRLFMELIKSSGFKGPIEFLNFTLSNPEDYLARTIESWNKLCLEVGLYDEHGDALRVKKVSTDAGQF